MPYIITIADSEELYLLKTREAAEDLVEIFVEEERAYCGNEDAEFLRGQIYIWEKDFYEDTQN
jgi:hypothetical protein